LLPESAVTSGTYMVSDSESVSLAEILTWLRSGMGLSSRLLHVPPALLRFAFSVLGREKTAKSLLGDLQVDSTHFRNTFGWAPRINTREGITRSGADFRQ
jgi:UDP-glucose 4-epimerase